MFTAKQFLLTKDYCELEKAIKSDGVRLRREFLSIAINPNEDFLFRIKSLRLLKNYHREFGDFTLLERTVMIRAFGTEFHPWKLQEATKIVRTVSSRYLDGWLLFLYCVALAQFTPNEAHDFINATRDVFKGSSRGQLLESMLDSIEISRWNEKGYQMEAG